MNDFIYLCTAKPHDENYLKVKVLPVGWKAFEYITSLRQAVVRDDPIQGDTGYHESIGEEMNENDIFADYQWNAPTSDQMDVIAAIAHETVAVGDPLDNVDTNIAVMFYGHPKYDMATLWLDVADDDEYGESKIATRIRDAWVNGDD